ncbi:MAG: hypothetical protein ACOC1X_03165 [Promethearchaeota archaeon]
MSSFKDYYNDIEEKKLDEEYLNEDPTSIVISVLAIPSAVALMGWVGSIFFVSYFRGLGKITSKIIDMWRNLFLDIRSYITKENVSRAVRDISKDPKAKEQLRKTEQNKRAFQEELKEVYPAIEKKDFNLAKEEFEKTPKYIQNNPDVHKVIISEVSRVLGEPPVYVTSPGNDTYKAIKKIINIRVAKAAAYATKIAMEKNLKNSAASQEQETSDSPIDKQEEE